MREHFAQREQRERNVFGHVTNCRARLQGSPVQAGIDLDQYRNSDTRSQAANARPSAVSAQSTPTDSVSCCCSWQNIRIASIVKPGLRWAESHSVSEPAERAHQNPLDFAADLLIQDDGGTVTIVFQISPHDVQTVLHHPPAAIGSDQLGATSDTTPVHPRADGSFARVLGWAVRDAGLFSIEGGTQYERTACWDSGDGGPWTHWRGRVGRPDPVRSNDRPRRSELQQSTQLARGSECVLVAGEFAVNRDK